MGDYEEIERLIARRADLAMPDQPLDECMIVDGYVVSIDVATNLSDGCPRIATDADLAA